MVRETGIHHHGSDLITDVHNVAEAIHGSSSTEMDTPPEVGSVAADGSNAPLP